MIKQNSFLGLVVKDLENATKFYTDVLGMQVNAGESVPGFYTQFVVEGDAIFSLLTGFEVEGIDQAFDTALLVDDVDATYTAWKAAGVEIVMEPRDMPFGRTFLFRTPDGHVLRAYTRAQPAAM